jgi:hypothetical protein
MKKKLYDYLKSLGFVQSNLPTYIAFTRGDMRHCIVFPKGKLNNETMLETKYKLVSRWSYLTGLEFDEMFNPIIVTSLPTIGMRKLLLNRIYELKEEHQGFNKSSMRWMHFIITNDNIHISNYNFQTCKDADLLPLYERIIKRHYSQM